MTLQELKDKCNGHYSEAIKLLESGGDIKEICRKLLDVASLLLDISKLDAFKREESHAKAQKIFSIAKDLRLTENPTYAYKSLTGTDLVVKKTISNEVCDTVDDVEEAVEIKEEPILETEVVEEKNVDIKDYNVSDVKPLSWDDMKAKYSKNSPIDKKNISEAVDESKYMFKWDNIPEVSFKDVAGLDDVKEAVLKKVILPLNNPDLYEGYVKKNGGGLLLYGPPGTGKTMIAAAIAHEIGAKFCSIGASDLVLNGVGNSEQAIVNLFKEARSFKCAVIFFDEIESVCPSDTRAQHAKQIRSELLRQMQGMEAYGKQNDKILFLIAATNKPWGIDPAFIRPGRFGTRIYIGLPDDAARRYMIENKIEKIRKTGKVKISDELDIDEIVDKTEGFNGADMTNLMDEVQENSIMRSAESGLKCILPEDFDFALSKVTTSVQNDDLIKLENWREENG